MSEIITVEAVGKFGVKSGGVWYGMRKPLNPQDMSVGRTYVIEASDWSSNGKSGKNVTSFKDADNQAPVAASAPRATNSYDDQKSTRILRQGIVQAVVQSPFAGLATNPTELVTMVKEVSERLIDFVEGK